MCATQTSWCCCSASATGLHKDPVCPTHEEYRAARGVKPVPAFVRTGVTPEPGQRAFIDEVSGWEEGGYRESFDTPASLAAAVTRRLHEWELSQQAGPVDERELVARTAALLPTRYTYGAGIAPLHVVVAGAPAQQVLRPSALDDPALHRDMQREAVYGTAQSSTQGKVRSRPSSAESP